MWHRSLLPAVYAIAVILLWPSDAWAWGPAAHIDLGMEVLRGAALLGLPLRRLLLRHAEDFLYGCCAADIVVGKNLARELHHCHNWRVGFRILDAADTDSRRALAYGFLAHLAADSVAHNFFVPYKSVESFRAVTARHAYWELRFDKESLERPGVRQALRHAAAGHHRDHDRFLEAQLVGASRLFSFATSRRIFTSILRLSRLRRWQAMVARLADRSPLTLDDAEIHEYRRLAIDAIFGFLIDAEASRAVTADPTGARSLRVALELRRELRSAYRRGRLPEGVWPDLARDLRKRFRNGIYARLDVPSLDTLLREHGHRKRKRAAGQVG